MVARSPPRPAPPGRFPACPTGSRLSRRRGRLRRLYRRRVGAVDLRGNADYVLRPYPPARRVLRQWLQRRRLPSRIPHRRPARIGLASTENLHSLHDQSRLGRPAPRRRLASRLRLVRHPFPGLPLPPHSLQPQSGPGPHLRRHPPRETRHPPRRRPLSTEYLASNHCPRILASPVVNSNMPYPRRPATKSFFVHDSPRENPPEHYLVAHSDGGARGNPGPAGYGVVINDQSGKKVAHLSEYLGHQTNNFAEYQGLIAALEYAIEHGPKALKLISDSELLVRQIKGIYKVKNAVLQDLHGRAKELIAQLEWFSIGHALREQNTEADRLANEAMDKGTGRVARASSAASVPAEIQSPQEFEGVIRNGVVELTRGQLPEGTRVQVRAKK